MLTRRLRSLIALLAFVGLAACADAGNASRQIIEETTIAVPSTGSREGSAGSSGSTVYRDFLLEVGPQAGQAILRPPPGYRPTVADSLAGSGWDVREKYIGPDPTNSGKQCILTASTFVGGDLVSEPPKFDSGDVLRVEAACGY